MFAVGVDDQPITFRSRIGLAAALLVGRCGNARRFEWKPEVGNLDVAQRYWHRNSPPRSALGAAARHARHLIVPVIRKRDPGTVLMRLACVVARDMLTVKHDMGG